MSRHTPGIWEAYTEDSFSGWWAIRQAYAPHTEIGSCDGGFDEADARIMAASPELLDALQSLLKRFEAMIPNSTHFEEATDAYFAIEKATGAAPSTPSQKVD